MNVIQKNAIKTEKFDLDKNENNEETKNNVQK